MRKSFITRLSGIACVIPILSLMFFSLQASAQCPSGSLGGTIYIDTDNDGTNDSSEAGQSGILVRAYDSANNWVGQSVSNSNGQFSITGLSDGDSYRIEFRVNNGNTVSHSGTDNRGDVQFVQAPNCSAHLGLTAGSSTCGVDTEIFLSCFVNGLGSDSPGQETILGLTNNFDATSAVNVYATQAETGSIWGLVLSLIHI